MYTSFFFSPYLSNILSRYISSDTCNDCNPTLAIWDSVNPGPVTPNSAAGYTRVLLC